MENRKLVVLHLPVEQLHPHPQNPRKELGDLTELADSIREMGIQQNLTVVPMKDDAGNEIDDKYTVIIGHRRLAAAKEAGLSEVPCCIRWNMEPAEQLALMLCENMQRNQLNPQEEGLAFQQLKLDFGWSVDQISQRTGFSRTKVRSRLVIAELDKEKAKKAMERQTNLGEFLELAKVKDPQKRNELLDHIGTPSFSILCNDAILAEQEKKFTSELMDVPFLRGAKIIEHYQASGYTDEYKLIKNIVIPEDRKITQTFVEQMPPVPEGQKKHYIYIDLRNMVVGFYQKAKKETAGNAKQEKKLAEAKRQQIAIAWADLECAWSIAYKIRKNFVKNIPYHTSEQKLLVLQGALFAGLGAGSTHIGDVHKAVEEILEIRNSQGGYIPEAEHYQAIMERLPNMDKKRMPEVIYSLFGDSDRCIQYGWNTKSWPKWRERSEVKSLYAWLEALGYEISLEEAAILDGTHEIFQREKAFEKWSKAEEKRRQNG